MSAGQSFRIYKGDTINVTDKNGLKQGTWRRYYESDTLFTETRYKGGKPVGATRTYYPNGKRKAVVTHNGNQSAMTGYHDNDSIMVTGTYVNLEKDGLWKYYDEDGRLTAEESYASGKKHGTWKIYYASGQPAEVSTWKDGRLEGPMKQFFENGKTKFAAVNENGSFEGRCSMFHPNGQVWFIGQYRNGLRNGQWIYNNEKGMRDSVQVYHHGQLMERSER